MYLDGKTVIVTGAGTGIGRALALACAEGGARVVLCGRRVSLLKETVELIEESGGQALAVPTDVTDSAHVNHMMQRALSAFGQVDVLINNAGSFQQVGPLWEADPSVWWHDVEVNLRGAMLCMRAVLPHMLARDSGIIVNLDGGGGAGGPNPGASAYGSSKAALARLTEGLARELELLGSTVLVFGYFPGFVRTEMTENLVLSPSGAQWQSFVQTLIDADAGNTAEVAARAAIRLIEIADRDLSGCVFDVDTSAELIAQHKADIRQRQLYVMRLQRL
jgi:NAD(P)-dependent dehydrogenase (short-subunit alcohol dehydrogenase family)